MYDEGGEKNVGSSDTEEGFDCASESADDEEGEPGGAPGPDVEFRRGDDVDVVPAPLDIAKEAEGEPVVFIGEVRFLANLEFMSEGELVGVVADEADEFGEMGEDRSCWSGDCCMYVVERGGVCC